MPKTRKPTQEELKAVKQLLNRFKYNLEDAVDILSLISYHTDLIGYSRKMDPLPIYEQINIMIYQLTKLTKNTY